MEGAPAAAAASMGAEARMEEVLTEAAASKAEDALASAGADIPTVALAAEHRCHPLTWAGGTLASAGAGILTAALAAEHRCHPLTWAGGK